MLGPDARTTAGPTPVRPARRHGRARWPGSTPWCTWRRCPTTRWARWPPSSPTTSTTTPPPGWPGWPRTRASAGSSTPPPARSTARSPATSSSTRTRRCAPVTPYAESKVRVEDDLHRAGRRRLRAGVRCATPPRSGSRRGCAPTSCSTTSSGTPCSPAWSKVLSDGTPWRPLVHAEDIAGAFARRLAAPADAVHGRAFNVGTEQNNLHGRRDRRRAWSRRCPAREARDHRRDRQRPALLPRRLLPRPQGAGLRGRLDDP